MESKTQFDMDELINCMHCGFCLPTCPTYQQTGLEMYSPRGRIALMKGVAEGKLSPDDTFSAHMDACLGCRACETACPVGVKYGQLIETARTIVTEERDMKRRKKPLVRRFIFDGLFNDPKRIEKFGSLVWFAQSTGLQSIANQTGLVRMFPKGMRDLQKITSCVAAPKTRKARPMVYMPIQPSAYSQAPYLRVGLFTGCVMDVMFFETNRRTAELLRRAVVWS